MSEKVPTDLPIPNEERAELLKKCDLEYGSADSTIKEHPYQWFISGIIEDGRNIRLTEYRDYLSSGGNDISAPRYEGWVDGQPISPETAESMFERYSPLDNNLLHQDIQ